jgi:hypothetical protein
VSSSATTDVWETIALEAGGESPLWSAALRPPDARDAAPVFSSLAEEPFALAIETIYEGYLLHYGHPRLFEPGDEDTALLLGDYLYAHGLVRLARHGDVEAVRDLAELISLCSQLRADARPGDGVAWAATAALLGSGTLEAPRAALRDEADPEPLRLAAEEAAGREAVERALEAHAPRLR